MATITANAEPTKIAGPADAKQQYDFRLEGNALLVGRSKRATKDPQSPRRRFRKDDRGIITREKDETLWAYNDDRAGTGNDAQLDLSQAGFCVEFGTRPILGGVAGAGDTESPAASDGYDDDAGSKGIGTDGPASISLTPPARATQLMLRADGDAAFDVSILWEETAKTYSSNANDVVEEVLPVYYISNALNITLTDQSGGNNTVSWDMAVV